MSAKRKIHSANFKAKAALDAYKADKTSDELISTHKVTSGQISTWKKQLLDGAGITGAGSHADVAACQSVASHDSSPRAYSPGSGLNGTENLW